MTSTKATLTRWFQSPAMLSAWSIVATFGAYFCMYGFRKPFTVAAYADVAAWGYAYKPLAVVAQVIGYMASKFIGIRVISELNARRRIFTLLLLIGVAELALVGFALTPAPWNIAWLAINGLPLGMVFGLVLSFLEGRRQTEALAAGLCTSFIVADGVTKSVGAKVLEQGVSQFWMPAVAGCLFALPLALFAWMLGHIPPPVGSRHRPAEPPQPYDAVRTSLLFSALRDGLVVVGRYVPSHYNFAQRARRFCT